MSRRHWRTQKTCRPRVTRLWRLRRRIHAVLQEPAPAVLATGLAVDNRISIELRAWVRTGDVQQVRSDLTEAIRNGMIELGLGMPAAARDVRVYHHGADGRSLGEVLESLVGREPGPYAASGLSA